MTITKKTRSTTTMAAMTSSSIQSFGGWYRQVMVGGEEEGERPRKGKGRGRRGGEEGRRQGGEK